MDHVPIDTAGLAPDVTTLAPRGHGQWPLGAVASALIARDVSASVDRTGETICISVTKPLPDRCPVCGSLAIGYGGHIADEEAFEGGPGEVLAADLDGYGWTAGVQVIETGDCLGDTLAADLDPLAPSGAHPELIADILLSLDWPAIIRKTILDAPANATREEIADAVDHAAGAPWLDRIERLREDLDRGAEQQVMPEA